jgi:hypothetical protein
MGDLKERGDRDPRQPLLAQNPDEICTLAFGVNRDDHERPLATLDVDTLADERDIHPVVDAGGPASGFRMFFSIAKLSDYPAQAELGRGTQVCVEPAVLL